MIALALALAVAAGGPDPAARFEAANARLASGDAEGAAREYEALLADGLESPALHVNLGAARVRAGRGGAAIASWLRALRLDPQDADARANLLLLRTRGGDRLARAPEPPFLERVVERTPDGAAAASLLVPWAALWALLALRRRAGDRARPALGIAAILAAVAAAGGGGLVAGREAERRAAIAVVIAPETPLRDGPEEALRPALVLREGATVRVLETRGAAARVRLSGGRVGFVAAGDLERL